MIKFADNVLKMMLFKLIVIVLLESFYVLAEQDKNENCPPNICNCSRTVAVCSGVSVEGLAYPRETFGNDLEKLDFSENKVCGIDKDMFSKWEVLNAKELNFSGNVISSIEEHAFFGLNKLLTFDLSRNKISKIPEKLFVPTENLEYLSLSSNEIRRINVQSFKGLYNLRTMDLSSNKIELVEKEIFEDLTKLEHLQLSYNSIKKIPGGLFEKQKYLTFLNISNNKLTTVNSEMFLGCYSLKNLSLAKNNISIIENKSFYELRKLNYLDLSENVIIVIEAGSFHFSSVLQEPDMEDNKNATSSSAIKDVTGELETNKNVVSKEFNLEYLNLSKNKLKEINLEEFFPLLASNSKSVAIKLYLDLSYNKLKKLDENSLKWMNETSVFPNFTGNPWDCSCCNSDYFMLKTLNINLRLNCATPKQFEGKDWDVIEELYCNSSTIACTPTVGSEGESNVTINVTHIKKGMFMKEFKVTVVGVFTCVMIVAIVVILIITHYVGRPDDELWWEDKLAKRSY